MGQDGLLVFGDTPAKNFPVVLVVGRESNASGVTGYGVTPYDWGLSPRSIFWNSAYGLAARAAGLTSGAQLKKICEAKRAAPVVFANASPLPISNAEMNKHGLRQGVGESRVEQHVQAVFALADGALGSRLKGVYISLGFEFGLREPALKAFTKACSARNIPWFEILYMKQGLATATLEASLTESGGRPLLQATVAEFIRSR